MAFRLFRHILPVPSAGEGRKVLIYGAGDGGEMVLRELKNNPEWEYKPIGFVDDDPLKKDKVIHGLKVYGGNGSLESICRQNKIQEILLSFQRHFPRKIKGSPNYLRSGKCFAQTCFNEDRAGRF